MKIAFYPAQSGKSWNGNTIYEQALGGSETAVVYEARELARMGHEVLVFTCAKPGVYDDVAYVDFTKARAILKTLPLDALICVRDPLPLLWSHRAKFTALWLHDLPQANAYPQVRQYWFVSAWQKAMYLQHANLDPARCEVVPNGIDTTLFSPVPATIRPLRADSPVELVWTSNPERGLWHAGEVLHTIQREFPKAELHVYGRNAVYGWDSSGEGNFLPSDMTGVVLHDALKKDDLAIALTSADAWVYPTWWPETYCISAVEAQMAGVPIVASQFGALIETCQSGVLVPGAAFQPDHVEAVAEATLKLLKNPEERKMRQHMGRSFAQTQTWTASANRLVSHITHALGMQAA